ncbi:MULTISPECIES: glycoside hydrolase family 130 protein [Paenibacillus]|jgi:beta-1,4-mannooligosaccharide/beta-1,4-mannosyl-N-acetylglucosamine phosphorylase|uniref:Beta-1,4-mannooligosaccharide/beta-1,4-mannosyl-N-acetylglucosamine phosphorylase n=1 Tax=Paenibacillus barengoltzii J12 TaxID=935846 RepID=A0ABY1LY87_9BACL|nr:MULTISPECIES: glycoside hydrolase family 130 protein [Paenibacillus]MEC2342899.1 glycoside hydrolase family 130 protein [Paenibacillus barengoltzii]SMF03305.1 beta-1,4-mannooligosaccharide/beta-1,4-mannosyl-N-acetylglucosamine phosphorylase [Paenibacillus barengoltzii]SMF32059.1 beta-1,4-mannooligosaccharide/beta-1,4-mannosyl-N-acetylglucosamine phosphorylase [Paenibacillus barengoltzii J12]
MSKIIGEPLKNIPWQDKPAGSNAPVWRYSQNPIIQRHAIPNSNSVFNSAVVPFEGGFAGVFRCDSRSVSMDIFAGFSDDGINWKINHEPIQFEGDEEITKREYRYDPRVCKIGDRYYITWCNGYHGPTIGIAYTTDFKTFHQLENAFLPYNRNGVLFPRKIGERYAMLSRPSDTGHTPFGDIFYSESPDLTFWGKHRYVMGTINGDASAWQSKKIGPGPVPIETDQGWLLIYHGVINTCNGFVYRMGCALLDIDKPWIVKARSRNYILGPEELYECVGDVPNVTFPCAALTDAETGRIAIYYGCADTVTGLAFTTVDELLKYMEEYPLETEA